jgi:cell division protein FtsQ
MSRQAPVAKRATGAARVGGADRFAARSRRRRLGRAVRIFLATVVVAGIGVVGWLVGWSEVTALEHVNVEGADEPVAGAVREAVQAPVGTPLIRIDLDTIADRVRDVPDVADVSVRRSWLRSLVIDVTLREPAAVLDVDGMWSLVDVEGHVFGELADRPDDLLAIDAPADPDAPSMAVRAAGIAVIGDLPEDLRELVDVVTAPSEASVELRLDDGRTVLWGTADNGVRKAEVLRILLDEADGTRYDVSAPDFPAVTR